MTKNRVGTLFMAIVAALALTAFASSPAFAHHKDGHDASESEESGGGSQDAADADEDDSDGDRTEARESDRREASGDQSTSSTSDDSDGPAPGGQGGNVPCPSGSTKAFTVNGAISNGSHTDGTVTVTVTNATSTSFSWTSTQSLDAVLVKAGSTTEVNPGGTSGTAQSPFNPNSGQLYDISHVTFCYSPATTTELCPPGTDLAGRPPGASGCDLPDDKLCPAGTDLAGLPPGAHGCDLPDDKLCPAGTNRAGLPPGNHGCGIPDDLCPAGTDMAGLPRDQVESCNDDDVLGRTDKVCPLGTDFAGKKMDDLADCNEDRVLPNVITRPGTPSTPGTPDDDVAAGVLPFTGGGGLTTFASLGAMLIALGGLSLRSRRKA